MVHGLCRVFLTGLTDMTGGQKVLDSGLVTRTTTPHSARVINLLPDPLNQHFYQAPLYRDRGIIYSQIKREKHFPVFRISPPPSPKKENYKMGDKKKRGNYFILNQDHVLVI